MEIHPIIARLVRLGVGVRMSWEPTYDRFVFDLQTGAKESMVAWVEQTGSPEPGLTVVARYGRRKVIHTFAELCDLYDSCVVADGNCSPEWAAMMVAVGHWKQTKVP